MLIHQCGHLRAWLYPVIEHENSSWSMKYGQYTGKYAAYAAIFSYLIVCPTLHVRLRRTAQIANEKVVNRIPFPCFHKGGVEKERETVRPNILRWGAKGIRIKDAVEKLWVSGALFLPRCFVALLLTANPSLCHL